MFMTWNPSVREQGTFLFAEVDFVSLRNVLRCCLWQLFPSQVRLFLNL